MSGRCSAAPLYPASGSLDCFHTGREIARDFVDHQGGDLCESGTELRRRCRDVSHAGELHADERMVDQRYPRPVSLGFRHNARLYRNAGACHAVTRFCGFPAKKALRFADVPCPQPGDGLEAVKRPRVE
jgi:hypothetical protein